MPKAYQKRWLSAARYRWDSARSEEISRQTINNAPTELQMIGALLDEIAELQEQLGRSVMEHG